MRISKLFSMVAVLVMVLFVVVSRTSAEGEMVRECETVTGSYGSVTEVCREYKRGEVLGHITEEELGIEDVPFVAVAVGMAMMSLSFFLLSKSTQRVYWLD